MRLHNISGRKGSSNSFYGIEMIGLVCC